MARRAAEQLFLPARASRLRSQLLLWNVSTTNTTEYTSLLSARCLACNAARHELMVVYRRKCAKVLSDILKKIPKTVYPDDLDNHFFSWGINTTLYALSPFSTPLCLFSRKSQILLLLSYLFFSSLRIVKLPGNFRSLAVSVGRVF
jgi:hypothetical protein